MSVPPHLRFHALLLALSLFLGACAEKADVVLYCALDQVFSEPLLRRFEQESGLRVRAEFDVEAHKTVGLVRRIIEERSHSRCDVFWNNEIAHTVRLGQMGLLAAYRSPSAEDLPAEYRDPEDRWTGFAARARVLIVNTDLADPKEIHGLRDLLDPKWKGRCGIARPLTGTTLTHAAALFEELGEEDALTFFRELADAGLRGDVNIVQSNGQVMRLVSSGQMAWGFTDTDDFNVARLKGAPVEMVYPDQDGMGTLLIPNTAAVLADAPHPEAARQLVDWILSEGLEAELAAADSAQIPLRASVARPAHVKSADQFRHFEVDWSSLASQLDARTEVLKELFVR